MNLHARATARVPDSGRTAESTYAGIAAPERPTPVRNRLGGGQQIDEIRMAEAQEGIHTMSGLQVLEAIRDGRIDHPSMAHTLGFRLTEVEHGRAVITGTTGPGYCNPNGTIHGSWPAALLDSCMGSSVHSMLPPGAGFTVIEFKIDFVRPLMIDTGTVRAEGKVIRVGNQLGLADGIMWDGQGRVLAKGSTTCLIFRPDGARLTSAD